MKVAVARFAQISSEAPLRTLSELLLPSATYLPRRNKEGLDRACEDDHYAFMSPLYVPLTSVVNCQLVTVPQAYIPSTRAMAISKNSSYRLLLQYTLVHLKCRYVVQLRTLNK